MLAIACSSPASTQQSGGSCEFASDCAAGLVCINHACSADLSQIQHTEEGGAEAAPPPMEAGPVGDGTMPTGDSSVPTGDSGMPPVDTGSPPVDTGSPP